MSTIENSIEIAAIQEDLKKKVKFSGMTAIQKRDVIDQLFPEGVAFWYTDPKVAVGDKVFGWGDPAIDGGGGFFGEITSLPGSGTPTAANINFKFQF
jgi:hypothetical protein